MTLSEFNASLSRNTPPEGIDPLLTALWHEGRGNWEEAHRIAQSIDSSAAAWIHAYLHRKEGDETNAGYWYSRAGGKPHRGPLDEEWSLLVEALLPESRSPIR